MADTRPTENPPSPVTPDLHNTSQPPKAEAKKIKMNGTPKEIPLADIIAQQFPPFDAQNLVVNPFEERAKKDATFEEELSAMLLDCMLEFHAWSSARPKHEASLASQSLEEQISQIMETEKQQGMSSPTPSSSSSLRSFYRHRIVERTRAKLGEFVERMKTALAALTSALV
ncbi:hypothetical protein NLJ89_g919 [Agrocybe chaxingu]|uniref:Uncharacterized protein n=1 Tax=Agrocybe chaxingu TaxID=84603 RepID=A0A9W8N118_9AGAR|nr:hypothetical protein NLJ89_g919 [Agrocybe chaxingu]